MAPLLVCALYLAGCATPPQTSELTRTPPVELSPRVRLEQVPFHPQEAYQCGPAALAMVLNHSGVPVSPHDLVSQVYVPARQGAFQVEMLAAARTHRRLALEIKPNLHSLLQWLEAGQPVVVLQNLGLSWYPKWHYAVAIGYDLEAREIILHSGETPDYRVPLSLFERTWRRSGFWGMAALEPGQLPRREDAGRYFRAASALEETSPGAKPGAVWQAGVDAWPASPDLVMGLANHLYRSGDRGRALSLYESVVTRHPDYLPAYNNLASAQMEAGLLEQSIATATRGLARAGGSHRFLEETLAAAQAKNDR